MSLGRLFLPRMNVCTVKIILNNIPLQEEKNTTTGRALTRPGNRSSLKASIPRALLLEMVLTYPAMVPHHLSAWFHYFYC